MSDPYCIECGEIVPGTECYDDNGTLMHALGVTGVAEPHELGRRIRVQAVRAANGRIQGWAVNRGGRELSFRTSQVAAMNYARMASWTPGRMSMSDAQKVIAEVLELHRYSIADSPVYRCICGAEVGRADDAINQHRAAEIDKALGGLARGTSGQWVSREVRS